MRRTFLKEGWERGNDNSINFIINRGIGKVVVVLNANFWDLRSYANPQEQNAKGSGIGKDCRFK